MKMGKIIHCIAFVIVVCFTLQVLSNAVPRNVCPQMTTNGQCCSIPFEYREVIYNNCTDVNHHKPWCSLDPVYDGRWGNCQTPTVCPQKTTSGKCCSIPFIYRGVKYNSCTNVRHNRPWCSLDPEYNGDWGDCLTPPVCPQETISGKCCSIPFVYKGVKYNSCAEVNHYRPWCSLDPVYKGRWDDCLIPSPTVCPQKTTTGQCCSIPFSYNGVIYDSCTSINHNKPWCSLDPEYKGRWRNCQITSPMPTVCPQKTTGGHCCSIPFEFQGVTYDSCTQVNHRRPWCSLDTVYKGRWGNCEA